MTQITRKEVGFWSSVTELPKRRQELNVADTTIEVTNGPESFAIGSFSTKADLPVDYNGIAFLRDVGVNGSLWSKSTGVWRPTAPASLIKSAKGWIMPSLAAANAATYSQTLTTITVTSTSHTITSRENGSDIYLAIGTVSTGVAPVAPVYANWFTNYTYVDANTFTCQAANSQTGTGVVNTNTAATEILELRKTIPAGFLQDGSSIITYMGMSRSGDGSSKTADCTFSGYTYHAPVATTSTNSSRSFGEASFRGNTLMISPNTLYNGFGNSAGSYNSNTVNLLTDLDHKIRLTCSAANAFICLQQVRLEIL